MGLENRDYFRDGSYSASLAAWGVDLETAVEFLSRRLGRPRTFRAPVVIAYPAGEPPAQRDDLAERLDEVLKKISEQGKESLTEAERGILTQASVKFRNKKQQ